MADDYRRAADIIKNAKHCIALTGAGVSVESGIPDFRSACGLWQKYDPMEYAHIDAFRRDPEKIWNMIFEMMDLTVNARPNPAHLALAKLEEMGLLVSIITQNIDNLHQMAGSKNVVEFHGNTSVLECLACGARFKAGEFKVKNKPPRCKACKAILKPSVIFFGEAIPTQALYESERLAGLADAILVVGTSAVVHPASSIPYIVKSNGAGVIEVNMESTGLTGSITDVFLKGRAGAVMPKLLEYLSA